MTSVVGPPSAPINDLIARDDYVPQLYLADRKQWSFSALRNELNTCLDGVRSQLVELINHDYQDFIDLSNDLRGMEPVLQGLRQPLLTIQQTLTVTLLISPIVDQPTSDGVILGHL